MEYAIEVKNLSKRFLLLTESQTLLRVLKRVATHKSYHKEIWALKDIDFRVKKGEKIGLVGDNGSGKTTLLRIILGVYKQTTGTVKVNGGIAGFLQLGIGMERDLSARDNIYLFGAIMGLERKEVDKRLDSIIDFSELREFIHSPLRDFSTGMHQRLAFSIAKEMGPEILILDELLVGSDAGFRKKCFKIFEEYKKRDKTLIMASHNMELTKRFCDKVLLLDDGNQVVFGPTDEVLDIYLRRK